jgi:tRNA(adenine34) deaminase
MTKDDIYFMNLALKEAKKAQLIDEVPIGCVVTKDNKVIAKGHNMRESKKDPLGHAEIVAIKKASKKLDSWRLEGCNIYITIEPCLMCTGAIIQSRISKIIYGADDLKGGAIKSSLNALDAKNINHHPEVISGVLKDECSEIIKNYFKAKRK